MSHELLLLAQVSEGCCWDRQGLAWKGHVRSPMLSVVCGTTLLTLLEHEETCSASARRSPGLTALGLGIPKKPRILPEAPEMSNKE